MNRGEIWLVNLNPTIGAEIQKTRPAVIVNDDELGILPLRVIVPLTDWKEHFAKAAWQVKIETGNSNNLTKTSSADCFQVRSVAQERLIRKIGEISDDKLLEIEKAFVKVLKIRF
jgi:mRNA interferase MazF